MLDLALIDVGIYSKIDTLHQPLGEQEISREHLIKGLESTH